MVSIEFNIMQHKCEGCDCTHGLWEEMEEEGGRQRASPKGVVQLTNVCQYTSLKDTVTKHLQHYSHKPQVHQLRSIS